jgi:hypothetical protein
LYRFFDWPGVDHLGRQVGEVVTAIGCRSAVHQFGKRRMMSELFGASGQHLSFADRKWIAEQQIVLGANHLVPHLTATTLLGARKRDYPPTISPHQPWWPFNRIVEEHLARLAELMAAGSAITDLLVVHPQESTYVLTRGLVPVGTAATWVGRFFHPAVEPETAELDSNWKCLSHRLLDEGYVFDFGDEEILANFGQTESSEAGSNFRVGDALYRAVVVPSLATIRPTTLKLLVEFAAAGGIVVQLGAFPHLVDGSNDTIASTKLHEFRMSVTSHVASIDDLISELTWRSPPEIRIHPLDGYRSRVWRYTKQQTEGRVTFVANLDRLRSRQIALHSRHSISERVTIWHTGAHTSQVVEISQEHAVPCVELPPGGSCLLVEGGPPQLIPPPAQPQPLAQHIEFESIEWQVSRLDENSLLLDHAEFCLPGDRWEGPFPVLAIKEWLDETSYSGGLKLRYTFAANFPRQSAPPLRVIVEDTDQLRKLSFNGREVPLPAATKQVWRDRHWHPLPLPANLLQPRNSIELALDFQPGDPGHAEAARRLGTTVESVIILGDFSVDGAAATGPQGWENQIEFHTGTPLNQWLPNQQMRYLAGPFVLRAPRPLQCGDICSQGLPFYAGRIRYDTVRRESTQKAGRVLLTLRELAAPVASVEVNGRLVGNFCWPPLQVDLSAGLEAGENHLSVTLHHSLRNLLGPHHHPDGEPAYVNPGSFRPEGFAGWLPALRKGRSPEGWAEAYAFVAFGLTAERSST